ncbi:MAG: methyltransferase [Gammaproteobacteria bacterium]|nr:methyltransferase [Gammaproteobacteria bacterium]MDD9895910.1 methyltransferase [Gammaproteobacteria bacterium]MDD9958342.1 methyltransferase [Gammaproteobacteria bacterium]
MKNFSSLILATFVISFSGTLIADHHGEAELTLEALINGHHRSDVNIARNGPRHPVETLEFFGLEKDMTVIEILPAGGWYTEIIAPYVAEEGKFYAAHFSPNSALPYAPRSLQGFEKKITDNPEIYGKITVRHIDPPHEVRIAPPESADLAMTFRNVHNWIMAGQELEYFETFYAALKPGGILGVVEHRALPGSSMEVMETTGYVTQDYVIEIAEKAGFVFVASSEINANSKDLTEYPAGVWTLPPTYRLGEENRDQYTAIGESDRMTLKFRKPQ